jgi:2'-hydroxyisoflavone reductase
MKRRELIGAASAAGLLVATPLARVFAAGDTRPLNILFMGGTGFIGPHMVRAVAALGHKVTLFNRGKSNPGLFKDLELIKGDRLTEDIQQLAGRRWDLIIDSSCYVPRAVDMLMGAVALGAVQQYIFISTISVYKDFSQPGVTEESPLQVLEDPESEDVNQHYGALKVLCEQRAQAALPGRVTTVRCGVIIGPGDRTDRFTYWPERVYRGGEVLAPGDGNDPVQTLDARDLADWIAHCIQQRVFGVFNATNHAGAVRFRDLLEQSRRNLNPSAAISWVPHEFLLNKGLQQMSDLPLWASPDGPYAGVWQVNSEKAALAGLKHRSLRQSILDTHQWFQSQPTERREKLRTGLSAEREAEVLAAWRVSQMS